VSRHEGDWEMAQLDFNAQNATQALSTKPYEVGYSQHESAERAQWGGGKLQIVDATHPVVYPSLGSNANYYSSQLYLGRNAAQGVGCDDTVGPSRQLRPDVVVIGAILLIITSASFAFVDLSAAVVNVVVLPFVAITTAYLYWDLQVRKLLKEPKPAQASTLPAEA
jgi:hypothetical protein